MFCPLILAAIATRGGIPYLVEYLQDVPGFAVMCQREKCGFYNQNLQVCGQSIPPASKADIEEVVDNAIDQLVEINRRD